MQNFCRLLLSPQDLLIPAHPLIRNGIEERMREDKAVHHLSAPIAQDIFSMLRVYSEKKVSCQLETRISDALKVLQH